MAKKKARGKRPYQGITGPADPQAREALGLDEEVVEEVTKEAETED